MDLDNPVHHELEKLIHDISPLLERLQTEYSKYFTGAEKKPPVQLRDQANKMADRLKTLLRQCQSHTLSFKTQGAIGKFNSYSSMWDKKLHDREQTSK